MRAARLHVTELTVTPERVLREREAGQRDERLAGRIPKGEYAAHVVRLRERYPLLSLPVERWVVSPFP